MMTMTREKRWLGIHSPVLTMQLAVTALLLVSSLDAVAGAAFWMEEKPDYILTTTQPNKEKKMRGPKNSKKNKPPTLVPTTAPTTAPPRPRLSLSPSVAPSSDPTRVGWAPDPSFYGTYKTNMNVTVILERTTITVSYQCLPKWSTYVYVYIVDFGLPLNTTDSPLVGDGFSAIGYLNSSNTTAPLEYARFDFVTETATYIHFYCDGDYDQLSSSDAINNDVADVTNLTAGCGTGDYPWAPLLASDGTC